MEDIVEDIREEEDLWGIVYVRNRTELIDTISTGWSDSDSEEEEREQE